MLFTEFAFALASAVVFPELLPDSISNVVFKIDQ